MEKEYSSKWTGSSQPRKQRKYRANAPIHKKRKMLSVNLSKDLRTKHKTRNTPIRKDDKVKILRGKFKGKTGKVTEVLTKLEKIYIENIQVKKQDGSSANVPLKASNLQIIELNLNDKKRLNKLTPQESEKPKKATKPVKTKEENKK